MSSQRSKRRRPARAISHLPDSDKVLTFPEWCLANSFSERTGHRILASGDGPEVVQLSPKRIGVTVGANRAWQISRTRTRGAR